MQCAKQWQRIEDESRDAKPKKENGKKNNSAETMGEGGGQRHAKPKKNK